MDFELSDEQRLIIDNVAQPAYDEVSILRVGPAPSPLTLSVYQNDKEAFVSGDLITSYFEFLSDPVFSPDAKTLACCGHNDEDQHLVIGQWTSERYDQVFAPQFTEDGKSVQCIVREGSEVSLLTVPLSSLDQ